MGCLHQTCPAPLMHLPGSRLGKEGQGQSLLALQARAALALLLPVSGVCS